MAPRLGPLCDSLHSKLMPLFITSAPCADDSAHHYLMPVLIIVFISMDMRLFPYWERPSLSPWLPGWDPSASQVHCSAFAPLFGATSPVLADFLGRVASGRGDAELSIEFEPLPFPGWEPGSL